MPKGLTTCGLRYLSLSPDCPGFLRTRTSIDCLASSALARRKMPAASGNALGTISEPSPPSDLSGDVSIEGLYGQIFAPDRIPLLNWF